MLHLVLYIGAADLNSVSYVHQELYQLSPQSMLPRAQYHAPMGVKIFTMRPEVPWTFWLDYPIVC